MSHDVKDLGRVVERRIAELEAKVSLAEDLLETLNRTVFRQQERIDQLQEQLRLVWQQQQLAMPGERRDLREEIPPHY